MKIPDGLLSPTGTSIPSHFLFEDCCNRRIIFALNEWQYEIYFHKGFLFLWKLLRTFLYTIHIKHLAFFQVEIGHLFLDSIHQDIGFMCAFEMLLTK